MHSCIGNTGHMNIVHLNTWQQLFPTSTSSTLSSHTKPTPTPTQYTSYTQPHIHIHSNHTSYIIHTDYTLLNQHNMNDNMWYTYMLVRCILHECVNYPTYIMMMITVVILLLVMMTIVMMMIRLLLIMMKRMAMIISIILIMMI